jgi:hypothetical protein
MTYKTAKGTFRIEADCYQGTTLGSGPDPDEISDLRVYDAADAEIDWDDFAAAMVDAGHADDADAVEDLVCEDAWTAFASSGYGADCR